MFKPHTRLKLEDTDKTKPALAVEIIKELLAWGFRFDVVLADGLYGESTDFLEALEELHLTSVLAFRSKHGVWLPAGQRVHMTGWRRFERVFSDGAQQTRAIRGIISGKRGRIRSSLLTTDPTTLPKDRTW